MRGVGGLPSMGRTSGRAGERVGGRSRKKKVSGRDDIYTTGRIINVSSARRADTKPRKRDLAESGRRRGREDGRGGGKIRRDEGRSEDDRGEGRAVGGEGMRGGLEGMRG